MKMQRQEIEQIIYQQTHQLPIEDLTEVLRFVEFVRFKNEHKTPNQETIEAMEAVKRGEYEAISLDELRQQWDEA
ncbi:MAG: hypothetical protein WCI06_01175 [Methylococcaceae bacterium]